MKSLHPYCAKVLQTLAEKYPWEQPFIQAANEVFACIGWSSDRKLCTSTKTYWQESLKSMTPMVSVERKSMIDHGNV